MVNPCFAYKVYLSKLKLDLFYTNLVFLLYIVDKSTLDNCSQT